MINLTNINIFAATGKIVQFICSILYLFLLIVFQNGGRHSEGHFDGGERFELGPGGHHARSSGEQGADRVQTVRTEMACVGAVCHLLGLQRHAVDPVLDHCRRHPQVLRRQLPRHRLDLHDLHDHLHPAHLPSFLDTHQKGQSPNSFIELLTGFKTVKKRKAILFATKKLSPTL